MKKKNNLTLILIITFLITITYTILVKIVDVAAIGPNTTEVGFSTINGFFHNLTGYNDFWYKLSKYLGIIPFLIVFCYGIIGLKQLIDRKSLKKVDKRIIVLGIFYVIIGLCYVLFEKIVINYRPVILEGVLEASYPSSHTVLAITICASSLLISKYYFKNPINNIIDTITWIIMIFIVIARLLSGVHWLTDIIGGILISNFLLSLYWFTIKKIGGK